MILFVWEPNCLKLFSYQHILTQHNDHAHTMWILTLSNKNIAVNVQTGSRPTTSTMVEKTHIFDANCQKQLPSEYGQSSKIKSQE